MDECQPLPPVPRVASSAAYVLARAITAPDVAAQVETDRKV